MTIRWPAGLPARRACRLLVWLPLLACALSSASALAASTRQADEDGPRSASAAVNKAGKGGRKDDHPAGQDLDELRRRIRDAQHDLAETEESRSAATDALKKSEAAIGEATRTLRDLNNKTSEVQGSLSHLAQAQESARSAIAQGQARLAALLKHEYASANEGGLTVWLAGDDPALVERDSEYLRRLAQARQQSVAALRADLAHLAELNRAAQDKADELARTRSARARERKRLQEETANRARMVAELSTRLQAQKRNLQTMERDEKRLTQLVERIAKALEEKRLLRERQQKERAERERLAREKAARSARASRERGKDGVASEGRAPSSEAGAGDSGKTQADSSRRPEVLAKIEESAEEGYDTEAFPKMRGRLRLPVTGELASRFGTPRQDSGLNWRGLFIRSPQGREVHAVATGRVVYSDALRGFGNLLIIDHGAGYMSLYGNNDALLAKVGDLVKGGATVASVGNSGGNAEPGLYFELRFQSRPFDPMPWVSKP